MIINALVMMINLLSTYTATDFGLRTMLWVISFIPNNFMEILQCHPPYR